MQYMLYAFFLLVWLLLTLYDRVCVLDFECWIWDKLTP